MKTIIIYYSLEGNTESVAKKIAKELDADLLHLEPVKAYPSEGGRKYFWGGKAVIQKDAPELLPFDLPLEEYDHVILGTPVWASSFAPPFRTLLQRYDMTGKKVSVFACQAGNGAQKRFEKLLELLPIDKFDSQMILIDPLKKPDSSNDVMIKGFCDEIKKDC